MDKEPDASESYYERARKAELLVQQYKVRLEAAEKENARLNTLVQKLECDLAEQRIKGE